MSSSEKLPPDFKDLFENAPCAYLVLGPDGLIVTVNATLCGWLSVSPEDLKGRRLRDVLSVAGRIFYETHFAPLLRMQGFFNEVALDLVLANGEKLPVLANALERRNAEGELVVTRVTMFQAKERRQYERDLVDAQEAERDARRRLEELNAHLEIKVAEQVEERLRERETGELREQFIAVLGHDLRNPLAAIDAGANKLLREGWTDHSPTILRLMRNSVVRMSGLIDNVLDLARSRLGGGIALDLDPDRSLKPTLDQVVDEVRTAHPERTIEASIEIAQSVKVDHQRVAQMFSNLLGNAVSHGAEDHPIRVFGSVNEAGVLELAVINAGKPIPPEMVDHLFKAFHRGQVRSNAEGLGLGLYIASQIAEAHGGRIDVSSDAEETRFTFRMPIA
jgi:sigma-B regulation protein RsbU (phosphoserine phosphatase)